MEPGAGTDIFHRQLLPQFVALDGFMLSAMVGKHPAHILELGNADHIDQQNCQLYNAFAEVPQQIVVMDGLHQSHQKGGQQQEQAHRARRAQQHRQIDHQRLHFLRADVLFQPGFKLAGFADIFLLGVKGRRIHQRLHTRHHASAEIHHAANQRPAQNRVLVLDELQFFFFHDDLAVLIPDGNGLPIGATHHNALNERLTADGCSFFLICHSLVLSNHLPIALSIAQEVSQKWYFYRYCSGR